MSSTCCFYSIPTNNVEPLLHIFLSSFNLKKVLFPWCFTSQLCSCWLLMCFTCVLFLCVYKPTLLLRPCQVVFVLLYHSFLAGSIFFTFCVWPVCCLFLDFFLLLVCSVAWTCKLFCVCPPAFYKIRDFAFCTLYLRHAFSFPSWACTQQLLFSDNKLWGNYYLIAESFHRQTNI